jgi:ubiquinone/menaquinone biosynthesis C-methylase UbiE
VLLIAEQAMSKGGLVTQQPKRNISAYCNYNDTFTSYDQLRRPNGVKELLALFRQSGVPLDQQIVLEGGFGTGSYIEQLRHHVQEIHGVEGSDEGYAQAMQKMKHAANVFLQVGNILNLTFSENHFHAYTVNQVLHHLDTEPGFPNLNIFLSESLRVLKPGAVLTINTSSQEQLDPYTGVFWNYKYIAGAVHAIRARHIPIHDLIARLKEFQFVDIQITIPSKKIFHERYYRDPSCALEPIFQTGDSVYCFLSRQDMQAAKERLRSDLQDGSVFEEMARAAERAAEIGEGIIISARTPF